MPLAYHVEHPRLINLVYFSIVSLSPQIRGLLRKISGDCWSEVSIDRMHFLTPTNGISTKVLSTKGVNIRPIRTKHNDRLMSSQGKPNVNHSGFCCIKRRWRWYQSQLKLSRSAKLQSSHCHQRINTHLLLQARRPSCRPTSSVKSKH